MNVTTSAAMQQKLVLQFNNEIRTAESLEQLKATAKLALKVFVLVSYAVALASLFIYEQTNPRLKNVINSLKVQYQAFLGRVNNSTALDVEGEQQDQGAPVVTVQQLAATQDDTWTTPAPVADAIAESVLQSEPEHMSIEELESAPVASEQEEVGGRKEPELMAAASAKASRSRSKSMTTHSTKVKA